VVPGKLSNCENPLRLESKMADDAQIFHIRTPIFLEQLKLETSNLVCALTTRSNLGGLQKTRSKGTVNHTISPFVFIFMAVDNCTFMSDNITSRYTVICCC